MKTYQVFKTKLNEKSIQNVIDVLRSGWIGLGPKTEEFEKKFAEYVGSKYCIGLNSCTSALDLAIKLLDIPKNSEIISTPLTFISSNHVILYNSCVPIFADVEKNSGCLDPDSVEKLITYKTKAIIIVHYGGYPANLDRFYEISRQYNIPLIEDAAHSCGGKYNNHKIGKNGLLQCFSFHAVKNLPMGDGGAITTNNKIYAERLQKLRWLGINKSTFNRTVNSDSKPDRYLWEYDVEEVGMKYHLNDILAAIGIGQLETLDIDNKHREKIANIYRDKIINLQNNKNYGIILPVYEYNRKSTYHFYPIRVPKRNQVIDVLKKRGISPGVHYRRNDIYRMYKKTELPNVESFSEMELSLPIHLDITENDANYIIDQFIEVIKSI